MSTLRDYHVFKNSLLMGNEMVVSSGYVLSGFKPGVFSADYSTQTLSPNNKLAFYDSFNTIDGSKWDVSGLASAVISSGKLVTEGVANTWDGLFVSAAKYLGEVRENIDISVGLEWVGRSSDLCQHFLYLRDSTGAVAYIGMNDVMSDNNSGTLRAAIGASSWSGTAYAAGASGAATLRAEVRGHNISLYIDGSLKLSGTLTGFITNIALTNTRYQTYNGKTAIWDNFSIVEI